MNQLPAPPQEPVGYPQIGEAPNEPDTGGLLDYVRVLQRHKGTVVIIAFLCALAGFLYTLPQTPIYQARVTIEIQGINENFLNMRDVNPNQNTSVYFPEYDLQTQVRVLQSASLLDRVVKKLDLDNKPLIVNETRLSTWRKALGLAPAKPPANLRERAIAMAAGALKVKAQPNTRLIEITSDSTNPQVAADFANTLTAEFIEQNLESRWQSTQKTGEWLARQMEDVKIKLEKSDEALQTYARQTGLLFTQEKDNVAEERLKQLQAELSKAQAERIANQSRYELAARAPIDSLAEVIDDPSLKSVQDKLTDLRRQLAELSSTYTPAHRSVKRVQAQISTLEASLRSERSNIVARIRNDFESAQRREKLLTADYANHARLMSEQADQVAHYNILKREVDTNRQLYDNMLQRVKEAGIAGALRASNVRVVDPARPPGGPYKPSLFVNTALGLLSGLFLGVAFVVFRERQDRTIQEPGETQLYLNVTELGAIPAASSDPVRKRRLLQAPEAEPGSNQLALISRDRKPSVIAESFRAVLTSILFHGENGSRPHVVVLSSANPKEGKTTVASNLAIALAETNHTVLLVDGDMRRPRVHQIFDLENKAGLSEILLQPTAVNGGPVSQIQATSVPNLSVLTSGGASFVPHLVYSKRLPELIASVKKNYDMVIIDTPPMLQMADARVMGRYADAVILVVRANQTTRDAAQLARQRLAEDGTRVLGTILNDWNPKHTTSYGYYRYYDHYDRYYGRK